jgi:hypothetical protein
MYKELPGFRLQHLVGATSATGADKSGYTRPYNQFFSKLVQMLS